MVTEFYVPRSEWEALSYEWIPDTCPVLISIVEAFEQDKTAPGTSVDVR